MDILTVSTFISVLFVCWVIRDPKIIGKLFEK